MSRVDEMRELVSKLAGDHADRQQTLGALQQNVQQQRTNAADAVNDMATARAAMSAELRAGLAGDLADLRHEVQTTVGDFIAGRQAMADELADHLGATRQQRQQDVTELRTGARQFVADVADSRQGMAAELMDALAQAHVGLSMGVRTLLGDFTDGRAAMAQELDETLAANQTARQQTVTEMLAHTQALVGQFATEHRATAAELRATLEANHAERQQTVAGLVADIQVLLGQIAADNQTTAVELRSFLGSDRQARSATVADFMAATNAGRRAMAEELADRLDHFKAVLQTDVSGSLLGFAAERGELHRSLAEMAQVWREFAAAVHGKPAEQEPAPVAPPPPPAPAQPAETEDVTAQILSYLAGHPEGTKLVDLEPVLGLARPQLGKLLRHLIDSGKVVKDPETLVYKLT